MWKCQSNGDAWLNTMTMMEDMLDIQSVMTSPWARFITFTPNHCAIHPTFLKTKAATSKEDNSNWYQAMNGLCADEY